MNAQTELDISDVLEMNRCSGQEVLEDLEKLLLNLEQFKQQNPRVFRALCQAALSDGENTLADAIQALDWAADHIDLMGDRR